MTLKRAWDSFVAVAGAGRAKQDIVDVVDNEANGAVGRAKLHATRMSAPESLRISPDVLCEVGGIGVVESVVKGALQLPQSPLE